MPPRILRCLVVPVCLGLGPALSAASAPLQDTAAIHDCMRANQPRKSSVQTVRWTTIDRVGQEVSFRSTVHWAREDGRSKALLRIEAPPDLRGSAALVLERGSSSDIFVYAPEIRKVRRINKHTISGQMFGTDFTYEDFERLQGMADDSEETLGEPTDLAGRPVYVLESTPARDGSHYERVKTFVDQETCIPLRTELVDRHGELRKVLSVDPTQLTKEVTGWVPRQVLMEDLKNGTRTELVVEELALEVDIPRRTFSSRALESGS